jgi:hypothetical protein
MLRLAGKAPTRRRPVNSALGITVAPSVLPDPLPPVELPEYSQVLFRRRLEGVLVRRAAVSIGKWEPTPNTCHSNVDQWCRHMTEYAPIRGWLYFDFEDALPHVMFNAHSVVRAPDGQLLDITPSQASRRYPFLIATEPEEEYFRLIDGGAHRIKHQR